MDVDAYQQDVVSVLDGDGTSMRCLGDMAEGGLDDLVDELGCEVEANGAILDACDGEEVLHGIDKPEGVVVDGIGKIAALFEAELLVALPKDCRRSGYSREGCPQIVSDGAQKVGAQLLVFRQDRSLFALLRRPVAFERQGAFAYDR